jgi:tRNA-Thr(GGU) m(6)t(6)A37 methyltransferase TsaA
MLRRENRKFWFDVMNGGKDMQINMEPIGFVSNDVHGKKDVSWGEDVSTIRLNEEYIGGLQGLNDFSHVTIIYYLDQAVYNREKHLKRHPQNREDMPLVGIFSQRGKDRPNRIGMTSVQIIGVFEDRLTVKGLDAIDGTPILDIKPYYPVYDRKDATVPEWVDRLMEHYF